MTAVASQGLQRPSPEPVPTLRTLADVLRAVGDVPAERVWLHPTPGTATVQDVVDIDARQHRLCELVDGILVEKAMGLRESMLASWLNMLLSTFVRARNLGMVAGEAGMVQLVPGMVRMADVCFISWARLKGKDVDKDAAPVVVPDLVIEVISPGNTNAEMTRKRREYVDTGVSLLWVIDGRKRTVAVAEQGHDDVMLREGDVLDGGIVLPGFSLPVAQIMQEWDNSAALS